MADATVQRGQASFASGDLTVTITAGTDYTAPSGSAFIRITSNTKTGVPDGSFNNNHDTWGVVIQNPGNLGTSITFEREASGVAVDVEWEIVEFSTTGANAAVVRHVEALAVATNGTTADTSAVTGVSDDSDIVVFITGVSSETSSTSNALEVAFTAEWVSASQVARVTRETDGAINPATVSVAVVEFTGSNWTVQRATHSYSAAGTTETETITAVGALSRAFIVPQMRTQSDNIDEIGQRVWLSATDELSFVLQSGADVLNHNAVVWVVENSQTGTGAMNVARYNGNFAAQSTTETITSVTLADSSVMGESASSSGSGGATDRGAVGFRLTSSTQLTINTTEGGQTRTWRVEVVEWPEDAGGGGTVETPDPVTVGASVATSGTAQTPDAATVSSTVAAPTVVAVATPDPVTVGAAVAGPGLVQIPGATTVQVGTDETESVQQPDVVQVTTSVAAPAIVGPSVIVTPDPVTVSTTVTAGGLAHSPEPVSVATSVEDATVVTPDTVATPEPVTVGVSPVGVGMALSPEPAVVQATSVGPGLVLSPVPASVAASLVAPTIIGKETPLLGPFGAVWRDPKRSAGIQWES